LKLLLIYHVAYWVVSVQWCALNVTFAACTLASDGYHFQLTLS